MSVMPDDLRCVGHPSQGRSAACAPEGVAEKLKGRRKALQRDLATGALISLSAAFAGDQILDSLVQRARRPIAASGSIQDSQEARA